MVWDGKVRNKEGEGDGEKNEEGKEKPEGISEERNGKEETKNAKNKIQNSFRNEPKSGKNCSRIVYTVGVNSEISGRHGQEKFFENSTWLTSNEAAEYLRLPSVGAIRVLVCKRRIPFHKLGRSLRFKRADLDRLLEASKHLGGF